MDGTSENVASGYSTASLSAVIAAGPKAGKGNMGLDRR